jgi:membrane protein DedA with SNARE-associated domain
MLDFFLGFVSDLGYVGVYCYMVLVGTFLPLPSQLILLPMGYLASLGEIDFTLLIFISALGNLTGAVINYSLAKFISKRFLSDKKEMLENVHDFFVKYGKLSIMLAPLVLGMGQYISIPAGIARMNFILFVTLTYLSNVMWNTLMLSIGFFFGKNADNIAMNASIVGFLVVIFTLIIFFVNKKVRKRRSLKKAKSLEASS